MKALDEPSNPGGLPPSAAPLSPSQADVPRRPFSLWLAVVLVVVIFSGGLFGYDQGVISGALHGIKANFSLSALLVEVVTSWVTLGALVGALVAGELTDGIGRKRTILVAGAMFTLGALVQALAPDVPVLVVGRLVIGTGVGVAAVAAPLYSAELAPSRWRGRFVSAYQLAITIGIFLAYLVDGALSQADDWRTMLGVSAVPGLLLFAVALLTPESPRWLMKMGRRDEAAVQLAKVRPSVDVGPRLDAIEAGLRREGGKIPWTEVFVHKWRRPLMIGVWLAIFQQITGINAIIYYADQIFASAGFATPAAQTSATTWAVGGVNVLATLIAIAFIDRQGRRVLLLSGLAGMGFSLVVVGIAFRFIVPEAAGGHAAGGPTAAGIVTLLALVGFITCFAFSMGPVTWTVINEIFPGHIRGRGVALATAVNWGAAFVVSQSFLSLTQLLGNSVTFWLFAAFCLVAWVWIYYRVPETKQQSLEDLQKLWETPG